MSVDNLFSDKEPRLSLSLALSQECPSGPNVILITVALSASVVVLGVALLLLWKLLTGVHDRREFAHFQRELEQRRWDRVRALPPPRKTKPFFIRQPVRRCAANVGICLGDFAAGTFLTTNSVKQGNSGKHGREETMGEREKKSYGKAKKNEHVDFCKNQVSSPTPSVYQQ